MKGDHVGTVLARELLNYIISSAHVFPRTQSRTAMTCEYVYIVCNIVNLSQKELSRRLREFQHSNSQDQ